LLPPYDEYFAAGVRDTNIKIQYCWDGEKRREKKSSEALELHVLVAARLHQNNTKMYQGNRSHNNQGAGAVENLATLRAFATTEEKQRITSARNEKVGRQETNGNRREDRNGDRVTTEKLVGTVTNCRETGEGRQRRAVAGRYINPPSITQ
jgi:hypothetical protein